MIFFKKFLKEKGIIHGILEKKDGFISFSFLEESIENILKSLSKISSKNFTKENLIFAQQVHGNDFFICPRNLKGVIKLGVDALISKTRGQILIIKSADCLPILIFDKRKKQVAAIHAGREGLLKGIIPKTIKALQAKEENLLVGIGPHIRKCCYYLRGKSKKILKRKNLKKYVEKREKKFFLDLTQMAKDQLLSVGIPKENIEDCLICTFCSGKNFFSFRRGEKFQNLSFIGLI